MFLSIVSGSSGNASLIKYKNTSILIDCGVSGKKLIENLSSADISGDEIDAILVTHEHSDHIAGVGVISRRFDVPLYATEKTYKSMNIGNIRRDNIKVIEKNSDFEIGDISVHSFPIPHDAADPVGYSFLCGSKKYSVATDIGVMTDCIFQAISGSDYIMLEANHDIDMLMYGDYPLELKKRILGDRGHLSNDAAAKSAVELLKSGTKHIMLSHLSDKNNAPSVAYKTVENEFSKCGAVVGKDIGLCVANRYGVTKFL